MRRLLNTLYVTTQGAYLHRDGENIIVRVDGEVKMRVPIHNLSGVVCFGQVSCSSPLMELCTERKVALSFLSEHGHFYARVDGPVSGNVLLRREQYRRADDEGASAAIARSIVIGKLSNCRTVLMRAMRDHPEEIPTRDISNASRHLAALLGLLGHDQPLETVRGIEGDAARWYFSVFDHLIVKQKDSFFFRERSRRPPLDNLNALLSFLYTIVRHDVGAALESVGLDPAVGFLHRDRPGRPGLALDMMEEFRPLMADRLALSLINRQQVSGRGFKTTESGAVMMDDEIRKTVLIAYQERKQEKIQHPFINETVEFGLLPYVQALLFARHLRGDLEAYPPYIWK
jgi:CRISPR-associated protein Cas1